MNDNSAFDKWNVFYNEAPKRGGVNIWPNDVLVRLMKGKYIPGIVSPSYKDKKILEIGFGSGNLLRFFGTLDMELYGVEVHEDICEQTTKNLKSLNFDADLKLGDNKSIPFPDNYFDYLVSWDVLHYEGTEERIDKAIEEYARVLKSGARFFISTLAPKHTILNGSKTVGSHMYEIGRDDDFRKGQVFFYFDSPNYIEYYFSKYFSDIHIGRSTIDLITEVNDTFAITGVKP
jgi:ubiquinone/menaquinone biosynthesis C-methylase UbiE